MRVISATYKSCIRSMAIFRIKAVNALSIQFLFHIPVDTCFTVFDNLIKLPK